MPKKNIFRYTALIMAIAFVALPVKLIYAASVSGSGSAMISTGSSDGNTLTVSMTGVTRPTGSMKFNAYLLDDSMKKTSVGNVTVDEDGVAKLSYTSDSDIMVNFRRLEIREESGSSSRIIFANTIPGQDVKNIRALVGKDSEITGLQNVLNDAISHATNGKNAKTTADLVISAKKMMDIVNGDVGNGVAAHVKLASEAITKAMGTNITGSYVYDNGTTASSALTIIQSNADAAVLSAQQAQTFSNFETGSILMNDALNSLLRAKNNGTVVATQKSYAMGSFQLSKLNDIYTTIKNDTRLTKLSAAINTAGMSSALSAVGPMTLLAPTDTAITSYGDANWSKLSNNSANLKRALEVHVLDSHLLSGDSKIDVRIMDSNRAKYTATDIEASNGIIHLVDTVIARRGPFPGLPSVGAYDTNVLNVAYGMLALGIMLITISGLVRLNYRKNI